MLSSHMFVFYCSSQITIIAYKFIHLFKNRLVFHGFGRVMMMMCHFPVYMFFIFGTVLILLMLSV